MRAKKLALIAFGSLLVQVATAADQGQLFGKWIEKFPNGTGLITEFTPTSISFYGIDESGKPKTEPTTSEATYKDLGDSIGIDLKGGGGIMALIKDRETMLLVFPGMPSHKLTRVRPLN